MRHIRRNSGDETTLEAGFFAQRMCSTTWLTGLCLGSYATPLNLATAVSVAYFATETAGDLNVVVGHGFNNHPRTDTRVSRYSVAAPTRSGTGLSQGATLTWWIFSSASNGGKRNPMTNW
jgi:hypothetical protein